MAFLAALFAVLALITANAAAAWNGLSPAVPPSQHTARLMYTLLVACVGVLLSVTALVPGAVPKAIASAPIGGALALAVALIVIYVGAEWIDRAMAVRHFMSVIAKLPTTDYQAAVRAALGARYVAYVPIDPTPAADQAFIATDYLNFRTVVLFAQRSQGQSVAQSDWQLAWSSIPHQGGDKGLIVANVVSKSRVKVHGVEVICGPSLWRAVAFAGHGPQLGWTQCLIHTL